MASRTHASLDIRKKAVAELTANLRLNTEKTQALREEEAQATEFHLLLHQQCQTAAYELQSLKEKQAEALVERFEELKDTSESVSKRWVQITRDQAGHRKQLRKLEKLRNILKSQHSRKIRLLMEAGLEAIVEKKATTAWSKLCETFRTDNLEEVIEKMEEVAKEKEALVVNAEEIMRENGRLRRRLQELEREAEGHPAGLHRSEEERKSEPWKRRRPGLEALAAAGTDYLRRTLATIVKNDYRGLLLPSDLPPFWSLSPIALSLLYSKAVSSAFEISRQRSFRCNTKRKSVLFALQIMLQNAITKQSSSQVAKRSNEQFNSHFVRPTNNPLSLQHAEFIGDLLLNVADYERTAIEATRLAMKKEGTESWKTLETDIDEARANRSDLILHTARAPICVVSKSKKGLKSLTTSHSQRQVLAAKELIAFNKTRNSLSLHNLKSQREDKSSFSALSASLRSQIQTLVKQKVRNSRAEEDTERGARSSRETGSARSTVNVFMTQKSMLSSSMRTPRKGVAHRPS